MTEKDTQASQAQAPSAGHGPDLEIRDKVRELTSKVLGGGRLDQEEVKDLMRAVTAGSSAGMEQQVAEARRVLADQLQGLNDALMKAAQGAHDALQTLSAKGASFTDNDLKEAFARLQLLRAAYVATVNRMAEATSGNIQRELRDLAVHMQQVGVDAGARVTAMMSEFASSLANVSGDTASSGLHAVRDYGGRMALLASGVLAGIADALREQSSAGKPK